MYCHAHTLILLNTKCFFSDEVSLLQVHVWGTIHHFNTSANPGFPFVLGVLYLKGIALNYHEFEGYRQKLILGVLYCKWSADVL